jgi:hypothetical protein
MWRKSSAQPNLLHWKVARFAQWVGKNCPDEKNGPKPTMALSTACTIIARFVNFEVMSTKNAFSMEVSPDGGGWSYGNTDEDAKSIALS